MTESVPTFESAQAMLAPCPVDMCLNASHLWILTTVNDPPLASLFHTCDLFVAQPSLTCKDDRHHILSAMCNISMRLMGFIMQPLIASVLAAPSRFKLQAEAGAS